MRPQLRVKTIFDQKKKNLINANFAHLYDNVLVVSKDLESIYLFKKRIVGCLKKKMSFDMLNE